MLLNTARALDVMDRHNLDALVATTPENVAYLSGFWILTSLRHRMRQVFAVITRNDLRTALVISRGLADGAATSGAWVKDYHIYGNFYFCDHSLGDADTEAKECMRVLAESPSYPAALDALAGCLTQRGVTSGRVGIDQGTDLIGMGEVLAGKLPGVTGVLAYDLFREIRKCKTEAEISRIRKSVAITEAALMDAVGVIKDGATEREVGLAFCAGVARRGGLQTLDCIGSGPRGAFPSVTVGDRVIRPGDVVRFDVGCVADMYHSDLARTAVLGEPSAKVRSYHDAIVAGEKAILAAMKPGAAVSDLFALGMETVRSSGIPHYQRTHCGHGNGIEGYDPPQINASDKTILEPGMVLCVETPYYEPGFAGLQIEDIVVVREGGVEKLTSLEQQLFVV